MDTINLSERCKSRIKMFNVLVETHGAFKAEQSFIGYIEANNERLEQTKDKDTIADLHEQNAELNYVLETLVYSQ